MSQALLDAVSELIQNQQYDAARAVLRTMPDEPEALEYLAMLDAIAPQARPIVRRRRPRFLLWTLISLFTVCIVALYSAGSSIHWLSGQNRLRASEANALLYAWCANGRDFSDSICANYAARVAPFHADAVLSCKKATSEDRDTRRFALCLTNERVPPPSFGDDMTAQEKTAIYSTADAILQESFTDITRTAEFLRGSATPSPTATIALVPASIGN